MRSCKGCRRTWCGCAWRFWTEDPAKRPSGREVIARLSGRLPETVDEPEAARPFPLIGRSRHRQVLDSLIALLHKRKTVSLFVFGRTGTGKTTLDSIVPRRATGARRGGRALGAVLRAGIGSLQGSGQLDRFAGAIPEGACRRKSQIGCCLRTWHSSRGHFRCCRVSRRLRLRGGRRLICPTSRSCAGGRLRGCGNS